ncbi:MAG: hypothetical protein EBU66_14815 [Bacteroidetes bacterium]|nr:hypothetical protein [bacterium]NBP65919.1 hypothetical protein [Bacteroidota bacterium]
MVYKLSEHNQILIALFAIVVLCAGKLFKDYLYRGGYIEGMGVTVETDRQFRRDKADGADVIGQVTFKVTLDKGLPIGGTIVLSWTGADLTVITSTNRDHYTASPLSLSLTNPTTGNNVSNTVTFTAAAAIPAGSAITIVVKNITIKKSDSNSNTAVNLVFTITSSNTDEPNVTTTRTVKILPYVAMSNSAGGEFTKPTESTSDEIKKALDSIQGRIDDTTQSAPSYADKAQYIKMRTALTALLASTYGTVKEAGQVFESEALYEAQRTAIDFIKQEKERAASNAKTLKDDNSNKRRMAQVNTYYTKNYEANTEVMKNIIIVSVALIILAVLRKKNLIPESIGTLGVIFILTLGGIVIGKQAFDIIRRNDHDFDKYDWNFNEEELNKKKLLEQNGDPANLSEMGMGMAACYGPGCCADGTSWSREMGQCLPNVGMVTEGSASWANEILTIKFKVPSGLKIAIASPATPPDTVTITLPSTRDGTTLFTQKVARTYLTLSGASGLSISAPASSNWDGITPIVVAKTGTDAAADAVITININGMALNAAKAREISKFLTVKTSKDTNLARIEITGV